MTQTICDKKLSCLPRPSDVLFHIFSFPSLSVTILKHAKFFRKPTQFTKFWILCNVAKTKINADTQFFPHLLHLTVLNVKLIWIGGKKPGVEVWIWTAICFQKKNVQSNFVLLKKEKHGWWLMPASLALRRLWQENCYKLETSLSYKWNHLCLKPSKTTLLYTVLEL